MLTQKQHKLLLFIHDRLSGTGISPSFEEMKEALDLKSKSGVHRLVGALEERGFLRRLPNRARALEILRLPEGVLPDIEDVGSGEAGPQPSATISSLVAARVKRPATASEPAEQARTIPFLGRIAAGQPIEAIADHAELVVPEALLGSGDYYALQVSGDSMIDAGILDGDFALVRAGENVGEGDIVVALIDDNEATLKYLRRENGMVRLDPANALYEPQIYPPDCVKVQGKLSGILRRY